MKNLSNYANKGKNFEVKKELEEILVKFHKVKFAFFKEEWKIYNFLWNK